MSKLEWDKVGEKLYEAGVQKVALYKQSSEGTYGTGVAWNGITAVNESPSGAESTAIYANNKKYGSLESAEEFGGTIEAYTYPDEWEECDGSKQLVKGITVGQQRRLPFGLVYQTLIGNDTDGTKHGYKLNVVYGAKAAPAERSHGTINESTEAITFSWTFTTTPVEIEGMDPSAHLTIDSTKVGPEKMAKLEKKLYGDESGEATLLMPNEIMQIVTEG